MKTRLSLTELEDRWTPAVLTADNPLDIAVAGSINLREANTAANAAAGLTLSTSRQPPSPRRQKTKFAVRSRQSRTLWTSPELGRVGVRSPSAVCFRTTIQSVP